MFLRISMILSCAFPLLLLCVQRTAAQATVGLPCPDLCRSLPPGLRCTYDSATQTYDYSRNWDFDGDGRLDRLELVGDHAAHLRYHPVVTLSGSEKTQRFTAFAIEYVCIDSIGYRSEMPSGGLFPQFMVRDFNGDGRVEIYLNVWSDWLTAAELRDRWGLSSGRLLLGFTGGKLRMSSYPARQNR